MTSRTTSTPKAALVGRTVRTSLAALALISASTAATYAQTVPAPQAPASATQASSQTAASTNPFTVDQYVPVSAPVTVAQGGPAPATSPVPQPKSAPFGHLPIIDATLDYEAQGVPFNIPIFNQGPGNQYHTYDPLDVGGTVRIPITPGIYAAFDRLVGGTLNQAVERVINTSPETHKATVTYAGYSRDVVLQYRLDEMVGKQLTVEEGLYFRHRLYANDGSGVSSVPYDCGVGGVYRSGCTVSSTEAHMAYLNLTYATAPIMPLFRSTFAVFVQGEGQNVDHHVGTRCSAANVADHVFGCVVVDNVGYVDENPGITRYYSSTEGITWTIPLGNGTAIATRERIGALNWYENQPFPWRWASANDITLSKRFNGIFTLAIRHSDYHSLMFGTTGVAGTGAPLATFLSPNAVHVASWDVLGTFHLDTNTWFH